MAEYRFLDDARWRGLCFFGCRIPGEKMVFGSCPSRDCIEGIADGFVIKPFDPQAPVITIPFGEAEGKETYHEENTDFPYYPTAKAFYMKHAGIIIDYLRENPEKKVVYSRVLTCETRKSLTDIFETLCRTYPMAYVFCFRTPQTGLWIGASPELLGEFSKQSFKTVALAGTMLAARGGKWSDKNKREQKIVADYIRNILSTAEVKHIYEKDGEKIAGPVKHLITEFSATLPDDVKAETIIEQLSPTPALSGYPQYEAIEMIVEHEAYRRGCYGGFCGIHNHPVYGKSCLWVNLRSMRINASNQCAIYSGGGLMPDSEAEEEWLETERKATTLLSVL